MKKVLAWIALYAGLILGSALIAPLLYPFLAFKFKRILSRCLMIATIGFVVFVVRQRRVDVKAFFAKVGFTLSGQDLAALGRGAVTGAVFLAAAFTTLAFYGIVSPRTGMTFTRGIVAVPLAVLASLLIGCIEEIFFRAILFRSLLKRSVFPAFAASSFIYAVLHFFHDADVFVDETPTVWDSFRIIGGYFHVLLQPWEIWPEFVGLFIFGWILAYGFLKSGSLLFSIGLHAGCVLVIKLGGQWTSRFSDDRTFFFGSDLIYNGLLGWTALVLMGLVVAWTCKKTGRMRDIRPDAI